MGHPVQIQSTTHNDVLCAGVCPEMRPVAVVKRPKKGRNFHASNWLFAQTTHVHIAPRILHVGPHTQNSGGYVGPCPGNSYIFQVSWKSVKGSRSCEGSKIALSHWLDPWLILQLVLLYKPRYTDVIAPKNGEGTGIPRLNSCLTSTSSFRDLTIKWLSKASKSIIGRDQTLYVRLCFRLSSRVWENKRIKLASGIPLNILFYLSFVCCFSPPEADTLFFPQTHHFLRLWTN